MTETDTFRGGLARLAPSRLTLMWGGLLVLIELLAVLLYVRLAPVTPTAVRYYVYPFVWINVGVWAILATSSPAASPERKRGAMAVAAGYFLVLAWAGGLISRGYLLQPGAPLETFQTTLTTIPPGWGPAVLYDAGLVQVLFMPYKVVGYLALAYLVYVTVLDAAGSAVGGVLGLLSCVSCSWPVVASLVTGAVGSTSSVAVFVYSQSYGLSTAVFLVTVALLVWRPTIR